MEKQMENEMETGIIMGYIGVIVGLYRDNGKAAINVVANIHPLGFLMKPTNHTDNSDNPKP